MQFVAKRSGELVPFDKQKIITAIEKAMADTPTGVDSVLSARIAEEIASKTEDLSVEEIQDIVENKLMASKRKDVARAYIIYRDNHAKRRNLPHDLEQRYEHFYHLITGTDEESNKENSNKDTRIIPTMRDYIAGFTCREMATKVILPPDIAKAHEEGIIHYHDTDYSPAMPMANCFHGTTRFVTDKGVRAFNSFNDGDHVNVVSIDGKWHEATVHCYGKQKMQRVKMHAGRSVKEVVCTANHRWVLKDGSITTNLQSGMTIYSLPEMLINPFMDNDECDAWTIGFCIGDGSDIIQGNTSYTKVRLCGEKSKYAGIFKRACYSVTQPKNTKGDYVALRRRAFKQQFLNCCGWRFMSFKQKQALFLGFYAADGAVNTNQLSTADDRIANMVREISSIAGYYISSEKEIIKDTNYKKSARRIEFRFRKYQNLNNSWIVDEIKPYWNGRDQQLYEAWCVEEPETKTFTLENGVVTGNCCLINLADMLQNGTVISKTLIERPRSFRTACTVTTQIITQVASSQYGGNTISLAHISPFIDISRQKYRKKVKEELAAYYQDVSDNIINSIAEKRVRAEIKDGVQTIQYQLITMSTTNGQAPFTSIFAYLDEVPEGQPRNDLAMLIEEVLNQRIQGVKNEQGVYVTTAFPKILYVLDEDNIHEDSKYYYLTKLAAKCTAKRLVPDYISAKIMRQEKDGNVFPCMGCRSFLMPYYDKAGKPKFYGRFNQGVVTINLPDVALSSGGDMDKFWKIFDKRLELCYRALMTRHNSLKGIKSDVAPILWQHGAYARLKPGETIDKLLYGDYSSISLGYAGLYECIKYMTGKSQLDKEGYDFGIAVMQRLNQACDEWKAQTNIGFSLYGSPIESTTYKFAKCLQKRFGVVPGITDKDYVTNSYHITPSQHIDAFSKLSVESEFQHYSLGGAISYIETPNMEKNIDAVLEIIKYIYNTIMYAEINTMTSYCHVCGCTDIKMGDDLKFHCPNCGNDDFNKMNIALRICGYISTNPFNDGRAQDIHDRVYHVGAD